MSFYVEVLKEKNRIDQLVHQGYIISAVKEDLSGARLEFTHPDGTENPVTLHVLTAEARIHFVNLMLKQQQSA